MNKLWRMTKEEFEDRAIEYLSDELSTKTERMENAQGDNKKEIEKILEEYNNTTKNNKPEFINVSAHLYDAVGGKFYVSEPMDFNEIILLLLISELTKTHLLSYSFIMEYNDFTEDQIKDIIFIQSGVFSFYCWNDECVDFIADVLASTDNAIDSEVKVVLDDPKVNEHFLQILNDKISHKTFLNEATIKQREREIKVKKEKLVLLNKELKELDTLIPYLKEEVESNRGAANNALSVYEVGDIVSNALKNAIMKAFNLTEKDTFINVLSCYSPLLYIISDIRRYSITDFISKRQKNKKKIMQNDLYTLYLDFPKKVEIRRNYVYSEIDKINRYIAVAKTVIENKREAPKALTIVNKIDWYYLDTRHHVSDEFRNKYSKFIKFYHREEEEAVEEY